MSEQLVIDGFAFARAGRSQRGQIEVRAFLRLHDSLLSHEGLVEYQIDGGLTEKQEPYIRCIINGSVHLECQRCLEAMEHQFRIEACWMLVAHEKDLPEIADEDAAVDFIVASPHLDLMALLEDELILALPFAPRHDPERCKTHVRVEGEEQASPFAVLETLKKPTLN